MVPSRNGPRGAEIASFGLAILVFVLTPTQVGHQDLAALVAQQPAVAERWREHLIASPFGTIHAAMFSLPRPVGTSILEPPLVRLASLGKSDAVGSIGAYPVRRDDAHAAFPVINRANKGDRLVPSMPEPAFSAEPGRSTEERPEQTIMPARAKTGEIELNDHSEDELPDAQAVVLAELGREAQRRNALAGGPDQLAAAMHFEPFPEYDISLSFEMNPRIALDEPADLADLDPTEFTPNAPPSLEGLNAEVKETRLYFGNDLFGTTLGGIEPWGTGEEPVLMTPRIPADPDMKQSAAVPAPA